MIWYLLTSILISSTAITAETTALMHPNFAQDQPSAHCEMHTENEVCYLQLPRLAMPVLRATCSACDNLYNFIFLNIPLRQII